MNTEINKTGASFNRGKSKQDYSTPKDFMEAVAGRFGPISVDLAASAENTQAKIYLDEKINSLTQDWSALNGNLWLNPPFDNIAPWAKKCAENAIVEYDKGNSDFRILFLVPASVGSDWYLRHVERYAYVLALNPRLSFDGKNPYPKDCILAVYGHGLTGFKTWRWK